MPPNLKNITKIEFKFTTKSTVGPFYINIDLLAYTKPDSANNNWVAGKAGKAIEFDGIDDYVYFPMSASALSVLNGESVSMTNCFWLKRYRLGVSEGLLRTNPDVYNEYWWAYIPPDNKVIFYTAVLLLLVQICHMSLIKLIFGIFYALFMMLMQAQDINLKFILMDLG
jgi:hypothetical protein